MKYKVINATSVQEGFNTILIPNIIKSSPVMLCIYDIRNSSFPISRYIYSHLLLEGPFIQKLSHRILHHPMHLHKETFPLKCLLVILCVETFALAGRKAEVVVGKQRLPGRSLCAYICFETGLMPNESDISTL